MTNLTLIQLAGEVAIAEFKKLPEAVVCIDGKEAVRYTPERTCQDATPKGNTFVCSECACHARETEYGCSREENGKRWYGTSNNHRLNYCPNCGARVRSET